MVRSPAPEILTLCRCNIELEVFSMGPVNRRTLAKKPRGRTLCQCSRPTWEGRAGRRSDPASVPLVSPKRHRRSKAFSRQFQFVTWRIIYARMSLRCFLGRHRPLLASISRREQGFTALCDDCGLPIERTEDGRWIASEPLVSRRDKAA